MEARGESAILLNRYPFGTRLASAEGRAAKSRSYAKSRPAEIGIKRRARLLHDENDEGDDDL